MAILSCTTARILDRVHPIIERGYPASVLRSTAVPEVASLRRLQFGQINSHRYVWVFKSPQHTPPKQVIKKYYGIRTTTIKETTRYKAGLQAPILR